MKNLIKLTAILIYIFIMSYLLEFELLPLFDLKQIFLVLIGMFILFLPGYRRGESMHTYTGQLARCAIFASYIQTFIMLFIVLSKSITLEELPKEAALSCRPLLYGICLWVILSKEDAGTKYSAEPEDAIKYTKTGMYTANNANSANTNKTDASHLLTASKAYENFHELGLTNRESELAVLICKGLSNAEIATELFISETTVKKHISNIFEKLGINRREQLLQFIRDDTTPTHRPVL
ncbi:MAG: response regulator transcription factor [Lachnospiraceae bacterium]|nr:response regulator transcription factor [Lachnospiraceae bacterium]